MNRIFSYDFLKLEFRDIYEDIEELRKKTTHDDIEKNINALIGDIIYYIYKKNSILYDEKIQWNKRLEMLKEINIIPSEIKIMINYLNKCKDLKKLTMICVLYETGARVSEFINIKLEDLKLSDNASITLYGKGNKTRIVPISQELVKLINKYLKEVYVNYGDDYLLYSAQKKKYYRNSINKIITTLITDLKINYPNYFKGNYHPHSFRHTKATHLYNNGTPLLYVKEFLGHSTLTSTEIYATPDSKKQREEILKNSESINIKNKYSNNKKDDLDNWLKNNMK